MIDEWHLFDILTPWVALHILAIVDVNPVGTQLYNSAIRARKLIVIAVVNDLLCCQIIGWMEM